MVFLGHPGFLVKGMPAGLAAGAGCWDSPTEVIGVGSRGLLREGR